MAQALITFRMNAQLKEKFGNTCETLGMTMTSAFTMLAQKMVREQRLPFDVSVDPAYTQKEKGKNKNRE